MKHESTGKEKRKTTGIKPNMLGKTRVHTGELATTASHRG
jgi:hypothetical protein